MAYIYSIIKYFPLYEKNRKFENSIRVRLGSSPDYKQVFDTPELANMASVSILIEDSDHAVGIRCKSEEVAVSSGNYSATVTATPSESDYAKDNPFLECAKRAVAEELGIEDINLSFQGLVIAKQKMQPVFLFQCKLNSPWSSITSGAKNKRYYSESPTQLLYIVPSSKLMGFIKRKNMTDAAAFQIWKHCTEGKADDN